MKIIESQKTINYFGLELKIPKERLGFIATDSNGDVYLYEKEPYMQNSYEWGLGGNTDDVIGLICTVDLEGIDCKETLMEIK